MLLGSDRRLRVDPRVCLDIRCGSRAGLHFRQTPLSDSWRTVNGSFDFHSGLSLDFLTSNSLTGSARHVTQNPYRSRISLICSSVRIDPSSFICMLL